LIDIRLNQLYTLPRYIIISLIVFFQISISFAQKKDPRTTRITYSCANKSLSLVIQELSTKSGIDIVFAQSRVTQARKINAQVKNELLIDVLNVILNSSRLEAEVVENVIVINTKKAIEKYLDFTISGYIRDKENNEPLPNASIYLKDGSLGVFSNEQGFYSLKLTRGDYEVLYHYTGFKTDTLSIYLQRDSTADVFLDNNVNKLQEIIITEDLNRDLLRFGEEYISKEKIANSAALSGESDILRSLNHSAGVNTGADGFGGQSVRGGNTDQNLILFDGIPLQNTGHSFGLVSILNSDIIQDARLYKSAMPARFGGRLSSFLDIKTRNGSSDKIKSSVSISTITSKATVEGPWASRKGSFLISARRTFADLWINNIAKFINQRTNAEGKANYYFGDLSTKFRYRISDNKTLTFLALVSNDELKNDKIENRKLEKKTFLDETAINQSWGNRIISLGLDQQIGNNRFAKTLLYYSGWKTSSFNFARNAIIETNGEVTDIFNANLKSSNFSILGLRHDYTYQISNSFLIRAGASLSYNNYNPDFNFTNNNRRSIFPAKITIDSLLNRTVKNDNKSNETNAYIENEFSFGKGSILNIGLHTSRYQSETKTNYSLQPRISLSLSNAVSWFNIAWSSARQYQQSLVEDGLGFPTDIWLSATDIIKPADGIQGSTNFGLFINKQSSINFGVYYKTFKNIISLGEGQSLIVENESNQKWQAEIPRGKGQAYGVEGTFNTSYDGFGLELNATYGKSTRTFLDINNAKLFNFNLDRRLNSNAVLTVKLSKSTKLNFSANYGSGANISIPTGDIVVFIINGQKTITTIYKEKNGYKLPPNFRMDLGFHMAFKGKKLSHSVYAGLYNFTNNSNPIYLKLDRNIFDLNVYEVTRVSLFPILPAISYSIAF
jgi:hypothetical protein